MDASALAHQARDHGRLERLRRGAALAFAEAGGSLVLAARREALLEDLAAECETRGGRALAVRTDVSARRGRPPARRGHRRVHHVANYTGHAIQPPRPLHDPSDVVETLVRLAIDPRDQEIVGADGIVKIVMKKLAPGLTSDVAARVMHRTQMEQAPPAADTSGAVRAPIDPGTEVSVGRRAPGPA